MNHSITESEVEQVSLDILAEMGYGVVNGTDIAPIEQGSTLIPAPSPTGRRGSYSEVVLLGRLRDAVDRLNPTIPTEAKEEAVKQLLRSESPDLVINNNRFHKMLSDGIPVEYRQPSSKASPTGRGSKGEGVVHDIVWLFDFENISHNEFLAVNQYTIIENNHNRRPDIILFVNGLPLVVIELKNPADENATAFSAFKQFQTYKVQIPSLFNFNEMMVVSDGFDAKTGTITSDWERFLPWKTIDPPSPRLRGTGGKDRQYLPQIEVLIKGMLNKEVLLDLVRHFVVFEQGKDTKDGSIKISKKVAAYHQYHAVNAALSATYRAMRVPQPSAPALLPEVEGKCNYRGGFDYSGLIETTRELRKKQTPAEEIMWEVLRDRRLCGKKFRRQHQIGDYIVDFYCSEKKVVIELDGSVHDAQTQAKKDVKREKYLSAVGNTVLRFDNDEVLGNIEKVIQKICAVVCKEPSPAGRGQGEGNADKRIGVIWHTQGSGKSLSMVFYTGKLVLALDNPTILVLTDRNDLDDQLYGTFSRCNELLRQSPVQADSRVKLREYLQVSSGGVVFTTIQKFLPEERGDTYPCLSDRRNIVVIADEAHRSQYDFIDGFAKHMRDALPNASFIGFTGTPIELKDKNTRAVFGDYIDIYDIEQSINDGATVRIYYESRLAKLELKADERPKIDPNFEEATEGEEVAKKEKLKSKWARLEAIVGSEKRVKQIAKDIVNHYEERLKILEGKAMIVCMSRRIAVDLHKEIVKLKPEWYHKNDDKGMLKAIMTGSATDPVDWQEHIRNKPRRRDIGDRMKDPSDPLKIVIVRDMWLTGFDVPSLHTMYIDKPMRGHGLMQAIARVNRVFKDKPGGLVVDYLGIADELKHALAEYTESGGKGKPAFNQEEAVELMLEKYEIVCGMLHGFDYKKFFSASVTEKMAIITQAQEHVLAQKNGKDRYLAYVTQLSQAFALSVPHAEALSIRDDVGFFQAVRARLSKYETGGGKTQDDIDSAIKQIISKAIASDTVIDIFAAAGLKKPDISILSDEFLAEVKGMPQKNLALELLKKLLNDEIKSRSKRNLIQGRSFAEMLENAIKKYQNKAIEAAKVIEELIELAKKMREADKRGNDLGLTDDEIAFYDALEVNDSAVKVLGDDTLRIIARELVRMIRNDVTIDWTIKETVQARIRRDVKRILRKYGYPPDKQEKATQTVLDQATLLCKDWAEKPFVSDDKKILFFSDVVPDGSIEDGFLPVYNLQAAATTFGEQPTPSIKGWKLMSGRRCNPDMFIAQVVGKSMEPTIPDGSFCLFRFERGGSRNGLVVLVESRLVTDPETHQSFTIKRYHSEKQDLGGGEWRHKQIILSPDNKQFKDIVLNNVTGDDFRVVAEFLEVLS